MNIRTITGIIAIAATLAISAPATAAVNSSADIHHVVRTAAAGNAKIHAVVEGSTVRLYGIADRIDTLAVVRAAKRVPGVDKVISHIWSENS